MYSCPIRQRLLDKPQPRLYFRLTLPPLLLLLLCTCGRAQHDTLPHTQLAHYTDAIATIHTVYNNRMIDDVARFQALLISRGSQVDPVKAQRELFILSRTIYATTWPYDSTNYDPEHPPETISLGILSEPETALVARMHPLLEFCFYRLFDQSPPYSPQPPDSRLSTELEFYDFQDGEAIADIGAGTGHIGLLIAAAQPNSQVTLTDTSPFGVEFCRGKVTLFPELYGLNRVTAVLGEQSDARLPAATFDKIIIRNTYHHFRKKRAMLASLRPALKPGGELLIAEPEMHGSGIDCKRSRNAFRTIEQVRLAGFRLVDNLKKEGWFYLRFVRD